MTHSPAGIPLRMASGAVWPLGAARTPHVRWRDVAASLSRVCRFNGHLREDVPHYSVAQHCCLVSDALPPDLRLAGLLHDAHEALLGDLTRPARQWLIQIGGPAVAEALDLAALEIDMAVGEAIGIDYRQMYCPAVRAADLAALATERRDLLSPHGDHSPWPCLAGVTPWTHVTIAAWSQPRAMDEWLGRLQPLLPLGGR